MASGWSTGGDEDLAGGGRVEVTRETPGVLHAHDLHVWSTAEDAPVITAHVLLEPGAHGVEVARDVGRRIEEEVHLGSGVRTWEPPHRGRRATLPRVEEISGAAYPHTTTKSCRPVELAATSPPPASLVAD